MTTTDPTHAPRTVITPSRREARDDCALSYVEETRPRWSADYPGALILRDAIEHGWAGATADIAERLDAIDAMGGGPHDFMKAVRSLLEELKREVGA